MEGSEVNTYQMLQKYGLGMPFHNGIVIAWGEMNDELLAIVILLDEADRIPNKMNYKVMQTDHEGRIISESVFPNIVPTVEAYANEYGMDY